MIVVNLGEKFEVAATNTLDGQMFVSHAAIIDGEIYLRGQNTLFAIKPVIRCYITDRRTLPPGVSILDVIREKQSGLGADPRKRSSRARAFRLGARGGCDRTRKSSSTPGWTSRSRPERQVCIFPPARLRPTVGADRATGISDRRIVPQHRRSPGRRATWRRLCGLRPRLRVRDRSSRRLNLAAWIFSRKPSDPRHTGARPGRHHQREYRGLHRTRSCRYSGHLSIPMHREQIVCVNDSSIHRFLRARLAGSRHEPRPQGAVSPGPTIRYPHGGATVMEGVSRGCSYLFQQPAKIHPCIRAAKRAGFWG